MDPAVLEIIRSLTWPGAVALVAFSPLGRAIGAWLQSLGGRATPQQSADLDRTTAAMERLAECLERQSTVLQQVQIALALLLDRSKPV